MPVSVKRDPFPPPGAARIHHDPGLRVPQALVLAALYPAYPLDPPLEWPLLTRAKLASRAGYTALSGTLTRALDGLKSKVVRGERPKSGKWTLVSPDSGEQVWEGNGSGDPHPGLLARGLVEAVPIDVDGLIETNYRITAAGIAAHDAHVADRGPIVRSSKSAASCTNDRYK